MVVGPLRKGKTSPNLPKGEAFFVSDDLGITGRCLVFVLFVLENDDTQNDEYDDCYYM